MSSQSSRPFEPSEKDPATAVNEPWYLIDCLIRYILAQHMEAYGRRPKALHLPRAYEAAVQIDQGRTKGCHEKEVGKLRQRDPADLFGCRIVWDAETFRIE